MTIMNHTSGATEALFLGLFPLSTHRRDGAMMMESASLLSSASSFGSSNSFPYEELIAAIAIGFFRSTVSLHSDESILLKYTFSILLALLAYTRTQSYELIMAVEIFSYILSWIIQYIQRVQKRNITNSQKQKQLNSNKQTKNGDNNGYNDSSNQANNTTTINLTIQGLILIIGGAGTSYILAHVITSGMLLTIYHVITPNIVQRLVHYLFPIHEVMLAYNIVEDFFDDSSKYVLNEMIHHLLFVTFHIQCGMGYLGIDFLRQEQSRKNQLIRMDVERRGHDDAAVDVKDSKDSNYKESNEMKNEDIKHDNTKQKKKKQTTATKDNTDAVLMQRAERFQKAAAPFIFWVAMPYMIQIIIYGNINQYSFACVQDEMHRIVRVNKVFEHENHLVAMSNETPLGSSAFAASMNTVITTVYDVFNRKLFSLPKICLLPTVMTRQPMLIVQVFPFIFISDWIKASVVSYMTTQIETLQGEIKDLTAIRTKVESFDTKNAELLQRSATDGRRVRAFTQQRWEALSTQIQSRIVVSDLVRRSKDFFSFLQRNFVFAILIDCALANLIAIGKIMTSEVFVFSRAIEDTVDLVLMRSRSEAELARMITEIDKLKELVALWDTSRRKTQESSSKLHCRIQHPMPSVVTSIHPQPSAHHHDVPSNTVSHHQYKHLIIRNLHYTRGTASARVDHLELNPGVYALTGANGSGKSTLFRIIMSCNTNEKVSELPSSINLLTPVDPLTEEEDLLREQACLEEDEDDEDSCESNLVRQTDAAHPIPKLSIVMPSSKVVEISQNFYWPLYSKPIDWVFEEHISTTYTPSELERVARKVAEQLHSLEFFQQAQAIAETEREKKTAVINETSTDQTSDALSAEATIRRIMSEIVEDKEDWFSDLSGGQKSKVELVRTVFLRDECPDVLLIDETMAPLDPASKELVMAKLKLFCQDSIVLVIYHTDVGLGKEVAGKTVDCVPSNNFFDKNIHLEKGLVHVRDTC